MKKKTSSKARTNEKTKSERKPLRTGVRGGEMNIPSKKQKNPG